MTVDFTVLQDWPDATSIERSAENIGKRGDLFAETVTDAQQKWRGLMSCYSPLKTKPAVSGTPNLCPMGLKIRETIRFC